jgi:hypothetical protein
MRASSRAGDGLQGSVVMTLNPSMGLAYYTANCRTSMLGARSHKFLQSELRDVRLNNIPANIILH